MRMAGWLTAFAVALWLSGASASSAKADDFFLHIGVPGVHVDVGHGHPGHHCGPHCAYYRPRVYYRYRYWYGPGWTHYRFYWWRPVPHVIYHHEWHHLHHGHWGHHFLH